MSRQSLRNTSSDHKLQRKTTGGSRLENDENALQITAQAVPILTHQTQPQQTTSDVVTKTIPINHIINTVESQRSSLEGQNDESLLTPNNMVPMGAVLSSGDGRTSIGETALQSVTVPIVQNEMIRAEVHLQTEQYELSTIQQQQNSAEVHSTQYDVVMVEGEHNTSKNQNNYALNGGHQSQNRRNENTQINTSSNTQNLAKTEDGGGHTSGRGRNSIESSEQKATDTPYYDIKIMQKGQSRARQNQRKQSQQHSKTGNSGSTTQEARSPEQKMTKPMGTQQQFFKLSAEDKLRGEALRRRQNKQYQNKLPKHAKETILIPTKHKQQPKSGERAANGLIIGGASATTQLEVAAWMGRQDYHKQSHHNVSQHIEEINMLQKVTQMAPSNGKERSLNGDLMHDISEARQAIFIDSGLKRTFPLTKNNQQAPESRCNGSRASYNDPSIKQGAHTIASQSATENEGVEQPLGRHSTDVAARKSNLRASSRGATNAIFNEDQAYANQVVNTSIKHQSTGIIRNVEWEDANDQVQHLSSSQFGGIKVERLSNDSGLNHDTLDRILLNRGNKKVISTEAKHGYRAKSYHSNRRSSFNRSSYNKNDKSNATVCRTSTDMNTNFDSMIARYQAGQIRGGKLQEPATAGGANRSAANVNGQYKQAQQFKNILEQPIGRMWFPSLGGSSLTIETHRPIVSSQRIPQSSTTAGMSSSQPTNNAQVKAQLNKRVRDAKERSKTSYNARQIQSLDPTPNRSMNRTGYAANAGKNAGVFVTRKQIRAEQVYQNISNLLENQETLQQRMKQVGRVKVIKNQSGVHVLPMNEKDMRTAHSKQMMPNAKANALLLTQQQLTVEQQGMLHHIRRSHGASRTPQLVSDSQSPISSKNPKIFIREKHDFTKNRTKGRHADEGVSGEFEESNEFMSGRPIQSRSQHNSSCGSVHDSNRNGDEQQKFVQGREYHISQNGSRHETYTESSLQDQADVHAILQMQRQFNPSSNGNARSATYMAQARRKEQLMQLQMIQEKLADQVVAEEQYLREMSVIKTGNRTFQHTFYRINPRSKVNMYQARDLTQSAGPAQRIAQPTVEGSLLKSRLITNRWLGQVQRKKRELEEKMFKMNEISMMPYSEFSIDQSAHPSAVKTIPADHVQSRGFYSTESNHRRRDNLSMSPAGEIRLQEMDLRYNEHQLFDQQLMHSRHGLKHATNSSAGSSINAYRHVGASVSSEARRAANDAQRTQQTNENSSAHGRQQQEQAYFGETSALYDNEGHSLGGDDPEDQNRQLTYREALTVKAFNQLDRLKSRIDRQQQIDLAKRNKQYSRVNDGMKQTQLMRDVAEEREILKLQQERLHKEAETNPDVLLSPRAMADKCIGKVEDFKEMYNEYRQKNEMVTDEMKGEIKYAMERQEGLGIPMFKQDFAYRLVKLNQVDKTMWETDFVTKVYKMVEDLEHAEQLMLAKEQAMQNQ